MSKIKYLSVVFFTAMLAGIVFVSCKDDDKADPRAEGLKAGTAMCAEVAKHTAPTYPTTTPPANFDPRLDYTDVAVLANLDAETLAYLAELADFNVKFEEYTTKLSGALGLIAPYQEYVTAATGAYDPEATDRLLTAFEFFNDDFKAGFKDGVNSCASTFEVLLDLMMQMQ